MADGCQLVDADRGDAFVYGLRFTVRGTHLQIPGP